MNWAHAIPGVSPDERARADDLAMRKHELAAEAAALKDDILRRMGELLDEEVNLYRKVATRLKLADGVMFPPAIQAMDYATLMRLLQGAGQSKSSDNTNAKRVA